MGYFVRVRTAVSILLKITTGYGFPLFVYRKVGSALPLRLPTPSLFYPNSLHLRSRPQKIDSMQKILLFLLLLCATALPAQLITTDPAAPTDDRAVTITFDATQGTAGLANCNCDVYLHTGVITNNSSSDSDWQYVQTQWGVANADWQLTPVAGSDNLYTYTFGPTIRDYYGVPAGETIERLAFVLRNADGTLEGKATGNADIFVNVSEGSELGLTVVGDPGNVVQPLGKPLPILAGATTEATITIFDNGTQVATTVGTELATDLVFTESGNHVIRIVAEAGGVTVEESFDIDAALVVEITAPVDNINPGIAGNAVAIVGTTYVPSLITISSGADIVFTRSNVSDFNASVVLPDSSIVTYTVRAVYQGETVERSVTYVIGTPDIIDPPAGFRPGAVEMDNGSVLFQLRAPGKQDVFVVGDFNNWTPTADSRMKRSTDGETFWLELPGLAADEDILYQYRIDGDILQPDPYSTLVLDPFNDNFISDATYAGIPDYPADATSGIVSWYRRGVPEYVWQTPRDYDRPNPKEMVVYELLLRDFIAAHDYATLTDTLDYLERLGVNAIELMPIAEFEGNLSWGYNVSYHMALDKYYGDPESLKAFVDEAHSRGIAVIVDVVYNHAFGQSSLARMWWDEAAFRPTPDNPYLNVEARHPFNVGYDFNHESPLTQEYVKVTTQYWLEEFRVDGFRWDLSKGFTQTQSNDVGAWNRYDAQRVARIKDYADHVWSVDNEAYMILEHLAERREEEELAQYGNDMYFWSGFNPHDQFLEASMGYTSNLRDVISENRGFSDRNLVAYMESHDEERMMYKNEQFGNSSGGYDVRQTPTGLDRVELASTFFYTVPGPKMLWQFGELGYDFSINWCPDGTINEDCRTGNKPIRWDYRAQPNRQDVYDWIADLNFLRNNYDFFHGEIDRAVLQGERKVLHLSGSDGNAVILGNFGVTTQTFTETFPSDGEWYDYGRNTFITTNGATDIELGPGDYRVYLDRQIFRGAPNIGTSTNDAAVARLRLEVRPNPTSGPLQLNFALPTAGRVTVDLLDVSGRRLRTLHSGRVAAGAQQLSLEAGEVPAGLYFVRVTDGIGAAVRRVVIR